MRPVSACLRPRCVAPHRSSGPNPTAPQTSATPMTTVSRSSGTNAAASSLATLREEITLHGDQIIKCLPLRPDVPGGVNEAPLLAHLAHHRSPPLKAEPRRWVGRYPRTQRVIGSKQSGAINHHPTLGQPDSLT